MFTSGDVDDRVPLYDKNFIDQIIGKLVGDKGYISKKLFEKLFVDGIQLITKLKSNMKGAIMKVANTVLLKKMLQPTELLHWNSAVIFLCIRSKYSRNNIQLYDEYEIVSHRVFIDYFINGWE